MAIKLKIISSLLVALTLFLLYLAFFTPKIQRTIVSEAISLETLLKNES